MLTAGKKMAEKKIAAIGALPENTNLHIKGGGSVVEPGVHPMSSPVTGLWGSLCQRETNFNSTVLHSGAVSQYSGILWYTNH